MGFNLIPHPDCERALGSQSGAEVREGLIVHWLHSWRCLRFTKETLQGGQWPLTLTFAGTSAAMLTSI